MNKDKQYKKIKVCIDCLTPDISDINCICVYQRNYPTIELEFEQCLCCHNTKSNYANTEFNISQIEKLNE